MLTLSFVVSLLASPVASAEENRAALCGIEASGPLRELRLDFGAAGETRIEGELVAGERVHLTVPSPTRAAEPRVAWTVFDPLDADGDFAPGRRGTARFVGWREGADGIDRLAPGIVARTRPPVGPESPSVPGSALALLPAVFLLAVAARRRRSASLLVSLGGALAVLGLVLRSGRYAQGEVVLLDLDAESTQGLEVRTRLGAIAVLEADVAATSLSVEPPDARVVWTGSFESGSGWRAAAPGAVLRLLRAVDVDPSDYDRTSKRGVPLVETWTREEGTWTARGRWEPGAPLPDAVEGPAPPGWLISGLPQGVAVLVGRAGGGGGRAERWIRLTGFR